MVERKKGRRGLSGNIIQTKLNTQILDYDDRTQMSLTGRHFEDQQRGKRTGPRERRWGVRGPDGRDGRSLRGGRVRVRVEVKENSGRRKGIRKRNFPKVCVTLYTFQCFSDHQIPHEVQKIMRDVVYNKVLLEFRVRTMVTDACSPTFFYHVTYCVFYGLGDLS